VISTIARIQIITLLSDTPVTGTAVALTVGLTVGLTVELTVEPLGPLPLPLVPAVLLVVALRRPAGAATCPVDGAGTTFSRPFCIAAARTATQRHKV
jgi:hypothetical protein